MNAPIDLLTFRLAPRRKPVIYVAHPVSGDVLGNCTRTEAWIRYLILTDPGVIYIAPWLAEVRAFSGAPISQEFYHRVVDDDCQVVTRCDGLLLVGGQITGGMARELAAARYVGLPVVDWSRYGSPEALQVDIGSQERV